MSGTPRLSLLGVYAHPDDEVFAWGGTAALEASRDTRVVLAVATGGEQGEVVNPELQGTVDLTKLPALRQRELACSARNLGISEIYRLGYRDSGMAGSESAERPEAFAQADVDGAAEKVVRIIRAERPQVVCTFDEGGGYGHPDHIMINRVSRLAFERAGDAAWYPDAGEPWQPLKLYYPTFSRSMFRRAREAYEARGLELRFGISINRSDREFGAPDEAITTAIDVLDTVFAKREAFRCYRTQVRPDFFYLTAPDDLVLEALSSEYLILVTSHVDSQLPETDVFAGIRTPAADHV